MHLRLVQVEQEISLESPSTVIARTFAVLAVPDIAAAGWKRGVFPVGVVICKILAKGLLWVRWIFEKFVKVEGAGRFHVCW